MLPGSEERIAMRENSVARNGAHDSYPARRGRARVVEALSALRSRPRAARRRRPVECPQCGFHYYASSKPTASGLVLDDDGRVLLARRARRARQGEVGPPGRLPERGRGPARRARRELTRGDEPRRRAARVLRRRRRPLRRRGRRAVDAQPLLDVSRASAARPRLPTTWTSSGGSHATSFRRPESSPSTTT